MPILQPQQTRIASGGPSELVGQDIYLRADPSGGVVIPGSLDVVGPTLTLGGGPSSALDAEIAVGPSPLSRIYVQDATSVRMKMEVSAGTGLVGQTDVGDALVAPALAFQGGDLKIVDALGSTQLAVPSTGGLVMSSTLLMNDETIALDAAGNSTIAYDTVNAYPLITFPAGRALVVADKVLGPVMDFSVAGINAAAYGSRVNNTASSISVPTATPTPIFTVPLPGGANYTQIWKVIVGTSDGTTNYETYFIDVGVFWLGTTTPHYTAVASANLPPGWSLTVPTITSGDVVFTHTFGSNLNVYTSAVALGQNIP